MTENEILSKIKTIELIDKHLENSTTLTFPSLYDKANYHIKYLAIIVENAEEIALHYETKLKEKQIEAERLKALNHE